MCTLHDFFSSKIRFIHTRTVIAGSHSRTGKNYVYASRTSCSTVLAILIQCAILCDWKLVPYLERKRDKLDPIGELAFERALNVHT